MALPFDNVNPVRETYFKQIAERSIDPADDAGHLPQLEEDGYLSTEWLRYIKRYFLYSALDGTTTPKAVRVNSPGIIAPADANSFARNDFIGFMRENVAVHPTLPTFINTAFHEFTTTAVQRTYTANAGTNRAIVLSIHHSSSQATPTTVTWNGISFVKKETITWDSGTQTLDVWVAAIGDSGSNQTFDIIMSGGGTADTSSRRILASTYSNVDQTNPSGDTKEGSSTGTTISVNNCLHQQGYGTFYTVLAGWGSRVVLTSPTPNGGGGDGSFFDTRCGDAVGVTGEVSMSGTSTFVNLAAIILSLNASGVADEVVVQYDGIVSGFTGLSPNKMYYLSDTEGAIGLTPGTTNNLIGKAISTTELLITH